MFHQIFVGREYRCLDDVADADLIIDCGANVGYSSAYFLSAFPFAQLLAVEPDVANFRALQQNLGPYGSRATALRAAVWSGPAKLRLVEDHNAWAHHVQEATSEDKMNVPATDIASLLAASGRERISILKIDIEGAERAVFSANYDVWLSKVDNLVIELHGDECKTIFEKAIAPQGFAVSTCDELTVCKRR